MLILLICFSSRQAHKNGVAAWLWVVKVVVKGVPEDLEPLTRQGILARVYQRPWEMLQGPQLYHVVPQHPIERIKHIVVLIIIVMMDQQPHMIHEAMILQEVC